MVKTKFIAIAAAAALAAMLGLSACGGQASSSAASSSATPSAEELIISWQGALTDGTLVDFISSDDGANGGLVLTKDANQEPKRWLGAMTTTADGKSTITDDTTKETINFTLTGMTEDGAVTIEVEGYGKGAIVPMTAADWARVAEAEELAKTLGTVTNTVGTFEDGSLIVYVENQEGTEAFVGIVPKNSTEMKTWSGKTTTAADGKETVTDDQTKETFNYTWTENAEDGTINIVADGYGKATLVKMTVADWLVLDEVAKTL